MGSQERLVLPRYANRLPAKPHGSIEPLGGLLCPGKMSVNLLAPCQIVDRYERNARDHDFGNAFKIVEPFNLPYLFPDQIVHATYVRT